MAPRYPVISSGKVGDVTDCHLINGVWVGLWLDILSVCMETIETVEPVPVTSHGLLSGRRLCGKNLPIIWYQMSITGPAGQPVNFVIITKLQNKSVPSRRSLRHYSLPLELTGLWTILRLLRGVGLTPLFFSLSPGLRRFPLSPLSYREILSPPLSLLSRWRDSPGLADLRTLVKGPGFPSSSPGLLPGLVSWMSGEGERQEPSFLEVGGVR